jgi:hypothetical protein
MDHRIQDASHRAIQRWEGEGGAIAEGPQQQPHDVERAPDTHAPKRVRTVTEADSGDRRRRDSRLS